MIINRWFDTNEFRCNSVEKEEAPYIDTNLIAVLTLLRNYYGKPVKIISGYRTPEYNKAIGGDCDSHHLYNNNGAAVDIQIEGIPTIAVHRFLTSKFPNTYGFGLYNSYNHIDTRTVKAHWDGRVAYNQQDLELLEHRFYDVE
jgi:uncharacterized protein YcbK (DUF882 family)